MVIQGLTQRTPEWLNWRSRGIGGSDAAVIMGVSPFKTRDQLLKEKRGKGAAGKMTEAMQRGIDLEPAARAYYEFLEGDWFPEACFEDGFMRASVDGWNGRSIVEFKVSHLKELPIYYYWQCQHNLMVSKAKHCDFLIFNGNTVTFKTRVFLERADELEREERKFWDELRA